MECNLNLTQDITITPLVLLCTLCLHQVIETTRYHVTIARANVTVTELRGKVTNSYVTVVVMVLVVVPNAVAHLRAMHLATTSSIRMLEMTGWGLLLNMDGGTEKNLI